MTAATTTPAVRSPRHARLSGAIAAEWTKAWSVRSTWYCLFAGVVLAVIQAASLSASFANGQTGELGIGGDLLPITLAAKFGLQVAQIGLIALAMLAVTSEYATGSIVASLQWVPVRARFVAAKLAVVVPFAALAGVALAGVAMLTSAGMTGDRLHVDAGAVARELAALGAYTGLLGALTVAVGLLLRSAAGTLTVMLLLLLVLPGALAATSIRLVSIIAEHLPGSAASALLTGVPTSEDAVRAFVILAAWAAGAVVLATLRLQWRDA